MIQLNLLSLLIILSLASLLGSCVSSKPVKPMESVYIGDYIGEGVYGVQGSVVKCNDPAFNDMVCLKKEDFQKLIEAIPSH